MLSYLRGRAGRAAAVAGPRFAFLSLALPLAAACGPRAVFNSAPTFHGDTLRSQRVLVLPVAVSSDYTDDRTGMSLDGTTRTEATQRACRSAPRGGAIVTCFDDPSVASAAALSEVIMSAFAHDQPVAAFRWTELGQKTGASFAVLFRPESQSAVYHESHADWVDPAPSGNLVQDWISSAMRGNPYMEHGYTISAILVDLRSGAIVRAGSQSREAPDPKDTSIDFDARPLVYAILKDLLTGLLDAR
jgi:hypothetical protein